MQRLRTMSPPSRILNRGARRDGLASDDNAPVKRVIIVLNPATKCDPRRIVSVIESVAPREVAVDLRYTAPGRGALDLLDEDLAGVDAVVAAGGDGTVAAVATAIGDSGVPLGIIPAGTTNVIAREQHIPLRPAAAARLIFGPHRLKPLDVGTHGDRRFLHMAGAGIDSRLFLATDVTKKKKHGWLAYIGPALRNLTAPPSRFTITADSSTIDVISPLVLIANGASILKPFLPIYRDIRPDDGWLDVIVLTAVGTRPVVTTLGRLLTHSTSRSHYVTRIRARTVYITADPPLPLQLDGDVVGETPAQFGIAPGAIRLIVPNR